MPGLSSVENVELETDKETLTQSCPETLLYLDLGRCDSGNPESRRQTWPSGIFFGHQAWFPSRHQRVRSVWVRPGVQERAVPCAGRQPKTWRRAGRVRGRCCVGAGVGGDQATAQAQAGARWSSGGVGAASADLRRSAASSSVSCVRARAGLIARARPSHLLLSSLKALSWLGPVPPSLPPLPPSLRLPRPRSLVCQSANAYVYVFLASSPLTHFPSSSFLQGRDCLAGSFQSSRTLRPLLNTSQLS